MSHEKEKKVRLKLRYCFETCVSIRGRKRSHLCSCPFSNKDVRS